MERRRTSVRRAGLAGVALLLLGGVSACGGTGPIGRGPVATVYGADISADDVAAQVSATEAATRLAGESAGQVSDEQLGEALAAFRGDGRNTIPTGQAATALTALVRIEILREALRTAGGEITEAQRTQAEADFTQQLGGSVAVEDLPEVYAETQIEFIALQAALSATLPVSDDDLRAAYQEQLPSLTNMCVSLIVTGDEASAQAALDRVEAGEDFGAVSTEVSTDPQIAEGAGEAGCAAPSEIAQSLGEGLLTAQADDLIGPSNLGTNWVISKVTELTTPAFEDVREDLQASASPTAVNDAINDAIAGIDITVDPRYGTWDAEAAEVAPPVVPGATTTEAPIVPGS